MKISTFILFGLLAVTGCTQQPSDQAQTPSMPPAPAHLENKKLVMEFYDLAFVQQKPVEAAEKYISAEKYIQHNPMVPDGRDAFIHGVAPYLLSMKYKAEVKRVIAENDLVVVHAFSKSETAGANNHGEAVVDIFRVENGKIVEHWDVIQAVPDSSANQNTMF